MYPRLILMEMKLKYARGIVFSIEDIKTFNSYLKTDGNE